MTEVTEPNIELVIFDCDGVLVDSEDISAETIAEMASELGLPLSKEDALKRFRSKTNDEIVKIIEDELGEPIVGDFNDLYLDRVSKVFEHDLLTVPGVLTVLNELPMSYCVASNARMPEMELKLRVTGLLPWFTNRMFSAADMDKPKPDPAVFLAAAGAMGKSPKNCLVIEDSVAGINGARAAGMSAVGLAAVSSVRASDLEVANVPVLTDIRELLNFLNH